MEHFSENATKPVYLWVEKHIKRQIEEELFRPGDKIPSERDLSDQLVISRTTIRRAIENLITQGVLERRSSSGTFVCRRHSIERHVGIERPLGFSEGIQKVGLHPESILLQFNVQKTNKKITQKLRINEFDDVVLIRRLRVISNQPICVETIYLPKILVPDLVAENLVARDSSLYSILEKRYSIKPKNSIENVRISYATEDEANFLGIKEMDPVLLMRGVTFDEADQPFEYFVSVNHPDRVVLESKSTLEYDIVED